MKEIQFVEHVAARCPCGLSVRFGETDAGEYVGVHDAPHCKDFEQRELLEYMRWIRLAKRAQA